MLTWSEAFRRHICSRWPEHSQKEASFSLRVTPSTIHYWCRGARPRDEKLRRRIERWSKGAIGAELPSSEPASGVDVNAAAARRSA